MIYTVNMKKAVAKCQQKDVPELDLPPFRAINRLINNMVGMSSHKEFEDQEMRYFTKFFRYMQMMKMMMMMKKMMDNKNDNYEDYGNMDMQNYKRQDDMSSMYKKMGFQNKRENYMKSRNDDMSSMYKKMGFQN